MNNPWWEQQQQMFKLWSDTMNGGFPGMEAYQNMYKNMMPNVSEYWSKMGQMMPFKNLFGGMPNMEAWTQMWSGKVPGLDAYTKLFDLWKGMEDPIAFLQNYQEKYTDFMQEVFKNFLPAGSMALFEKPQDLVNTCIDFYKSFLSPWMQIDASILERIAAGDRRAYIDFFKDFNIKYEASVEKMFSMMGMGANRESNEDQMKVMNAYIKMLFTAGELVALVTDSCRDSAKVLVERYQKNIKEGKVVTTFREFYNLWYSVTEEILLGLLNTDEFSKVFGDFADKYAQYMIACNKVQERMLASLPIPTKTDMDSLYKTVYDLRKAVRDLTREIEEIKGKKGDK